jgi:hypothetical protein
MDTLLLVVYTSLPWVAVVVLSLMAVAGAGVGLVWPRFLAYIYLAVFFFRNSTSYGSLATVGTLGVYSRGSGVLLFPLLLWIMFAVWCCARVSASFGRYPAPPCNLRPWLLGWLLLLGAHVAAGMFTGVKLSESVAPSGFSHIVWMAPLVSLMLLSFRTSEHAIELSRFILLAGLTRAGFGLARWAVAGGDPNNVYANMNDIKIKLTFFDINDSLLCTVAFAIAAVNLFQILKQKGSPFWTLVDWATLLATTACVVLSFRRTAWIGFLLAGLIVMMRFPLQRRMQLAALGLPIIGAGLLVAAVKRLGQTKGAGHGLASLLYDMESRRFGAESERVLELKLALSDFISHPFTGIGAWGRYTGYQQIAWQDGPEGGLFLHSGVLHIALKAGLPGLVLLFGTIGAFVLFARRALREVPPDLLGLATAGAAGLAFMLPDLLVGTPFPQVRTTQMLAICMALPYVAMAVAGSVPAAGTAAVAARRRFNITPVPASASPSTPAAASSPASSSARA